MVRDNGKTSVAKRREGSVGQLDRWTTSKYRYYTQQNEVKKLEFVRASQEA